MKPNNGTQLTLLDNVELALREANTVLKAKDLMNKAAAIEMFARRAMNRDLELLAAEASFRVIRKLGGLLLESPKATGAKGLGPIAVKKNYRNQPPTLAALGITKQLSSEAQRLAKVKEQDFENYILEGKLVGERPSVSDLLKGRNPHAVHHSSKSDEHYTPKEIVALVKACFGGVIDLDPCCNPGPPNVTAKRHYRKQDDGLSMHWCGNTFANPPYGADVVHWVRKAIEEFQTGRTEAIILLLAARTDTAWFNALAGFPVCFLRGRLTFVGNKDAAPFPSAVFFLSEQAPDIFAATFDEVGTTYLRYSAE